VTNDREDHILARCPFCNEILPDKWLKKNGASLLGKSGGKAKARNNASAAANARWKKHFKEKKRNRLSGTK